MERGSMGRVLSPRDTHDDSVWCDRLYTVDQGDVARLGIPDTLYRDDCVVGIIVRPPFRTLAVLTTVGRLLFYVFSVIKVGVDVGGASIRWVLFPNMISEV